MSTEFFHYLSLKEDDFSPTKKLFATAITFITGDAKYFMKSKLS